MKKWIAAVSVILALACEARRSEPAKPSPEALKALFDGCTRSADPRWIQLNCDRLQLTLTTDAKRTTSQMKSFLAGYADGMKKDGAEWLDLGPLRTVRTTFGQGDLRTVTLAGAWKPDGEKFADVTCNVPESQEDRCRKMVDAVGFFGLP